MTGSQGDLLWLTCDGPAGQYSSKLRSAVKQHVMLNFFDKRFPQAQDNTLVQRKSSSRKNAVSTKRIPVGPLPCPQPVPALVRDEDQLVYRAAWWHCYVHPDFSAPRLDTPNWQQDGKRKWHAGFWELARLDETVLQLFMSFAAAKEAVVRHLPDAPAHWYHRGKALRLVAEDIENEGPGLRMEAIATIALLAFNYFIEGDYDSTEVHCQALVRLVAGHLNTLPDIVWLSVVCVEMYLSGVSTRGFTLPYHLHPDFRSLYFYNPSENIVNAASSSLSKLPAGTVFSKYHMHRTQRLMQGLYALVHAQTRPDLDWTAPWGHIYDVSYLLAQLQVEVERHWSLEEYIVLVGCQMQFWGMMTAFINHPDIQSHQLHRLAQAITQIDPSTLCARWLASTGSLDSLLWTLCNAGVSVLHLEGVGSVAAGALPGLLQPAVSFVFQQLQISGPEDLKTRLQQMPFTDRWNGRACRYFSTWSEAENAILPSLSMTSSHASVSPAENRFERLRSVFDHWLGE